VNILQLELTEAQARLLRPIVQEAVDDREHAYFVAVDVPYIENGLSVWKLQVVRIRQKVSAKIRKLILADIAAQNDGQLHVGDRNAGREGLDENEPNGGKATRN
jgi:hypothetical protein